MEVIECVEKCKEKECKWLYEPDELGILDVGCILMCEDKCKDKHNHRGGE